MNRPLEGIRVVECGLYHAGPGGCAILGDLGAEVIKVEQPVTGDPIREAKKLDRFYEGVFCRNNKYFAVFRFPPDFVEAVRPALSRWHLFVSDLA